MKPESPLRRIDSSRDAFVAGLREPTIFCPADLVRRVSSEELRAVLLHEEHHRRSFAPLRLTLIAALATALPVPAIRRWTLAAKAGIEIAADDYALAAGADRASLAAALLRLADFPPDLASFASSSELRIRALLGEEVLSVDRGRSTALALASAALSLGCLGLYIT